MSREQIPFLTTRSGGLPVMHVRIGISEAEHAALRAIGDDVTIPAPIEADALVDTGSMRTFVPAGYVGRLGLYPRGYAQVAQPLSEAVRVNLYDISISLIGRHASGWRAMTLAPTVQAGVLPERASGPRRFPMPILGRDVLNNCSFVYNGPGQRLEPIPARRGLFGRV